MAAPLMSMQLCCKQATLLMVARRSWSSSPGTEPLYKRLLFSLTQRFYDIEMLLYWTNKLKNSRLQKKNAYYSYTQKHYGENIATAYYILSMKGGFRFSGQSEWFRLDQRGKFSWDFLNHRKTTLEEIDMSHAAINYTGVGNLVGHPLRTLSFRGCPEMDDWALARLHMFQDTLEELDISHCPRITTGGLVALRNLKGLHRLDMSSLPRIVNPGLVIILLEEMLPHCQITATGYSHSLREQEQEQEEGDTQRQGQR